ncbi:S1 family peptidase [Pilimelia anulata]|nr:serine protease [Pilimelia anulata]
MHGPSVRSLLAALVGAATLLAPAAAGATDRTPAPDAGSTRIIGGNKARDGAYPWMTWLSVKHKSVTYVCGGTLVSRDIVLTAQQCVAEKPQQGRPVTITADIGELDHTEAAAAGAQRRGVQYYAGKGVGAGDWAVVKLDKPFKAAAYPLLPADDTLDDAEEARVLGWGRTAANSDKLSPVLRQADVLQYTGRLCNAARDAELCAGDPKEPDTGVCAGDHGGPLIAAPAAAAADWVQLGITSVVDCAQANKVGRYARVSAFTEKIQAAIVLLDGTPAGTTADRR